MYVCMGWRDKTFRSDKIKKKSHKVLPICTLANDVNN